MDFKGIKKRYGEFDHYYPVLKKLKIEWSEGNYHNINLLTEIAPKIKDTKIESLDISLKLKNKMDDKWLGLYNAIIDKNKFLKEVKLYVKTLELNIIKTLIDNISKKDNIESITFYYMDDDIPNDTLKYIIRIVKHSNQIIEFVPFSDQGRNLSKEMEELEEINKNRKNQLKKYKPNPFNEIYDINMKYDPKYKNIKDKISDNGEVRFHFDDPRHKKARIKLAIKKEIKEDEWIVREWNREWVVGKCIHVLKKDYKIDEEQSITQKHYMIVSKYRFNNNRIDEQIISCSFNDRMVTDVIFLDSDDLTFYEEHSFYDNLLKVKSLLLKVVE
jgi:hypothetical protein